MARARPFRMLSALLALSLLAFAAPAMALPPGETGVIEHRYEILDPIDFQEAGLAAEVFAVPALPANAYPGEFEAMRAHAPGVRLASVIHAAESAPRLQPAIYENAFPATPFDQRLIC